MVAAVQATPAADALRAVKPPAEADGASRAAAIKHLTVRLPAETAGGSPEAEVPRLPTGRAANAAVHATAETAPVSPSRILSTKRA